MAMNKIDKAEMQKLRERFALRFSDRAEPEKIDVGSVAQFGKLTVAWRFNKYSREVGQGCFNSVNHSTHSTVKTDRQTCGGPWYATKADALIAMRLRVQDDFATMLEKIDSEIDRAKAETCEARDE